MQQLYAVQMDLTAVLLLILAADSIRSLCLSCQSVQECKYL